MSERKYYRCPLRAKRGRYPKVCYQSGGFFSEPKYMHEIYFYEENGQFYEFFSGKPLGGGTLSFSDSNLIVTTTWKDSYHAPYTSGELSPSAFAEAVKPYMSYRNTIISSLDRLFAEQRAEWQAQQRKEQEAESAKQKQQADNESWLNNILDSRK